jgi:hypothetical protein
MDSVLWRSHANAATSIEAHQPDSLNQTGPVSGEQAIRLSSARERFDHVMFGKERFKARLVLPSLWLMQAKQVGGLKGCGQTMGQALKR